MQIVAPAGSKASFFAAVNAGADAVYLGLPYFGARAKAQNFEKDDFIEAVRYAHTFGVKVFVTLNTLIKENELDKALELAKFAYDTECDAAIVQDIRFIRLLKKELPCFTLHGSTQMGVHNAEGARALLDMGISRAVLARETVADDIPRIKETGIDIEFFVQGALCVCFSGNCYFSSLASSYSGNRGKCMQLCRKPYFFNGKKGYYLSAKDLCMYDRLDELKRLGVDAIKIEGRMRSEEYVAQAVRVYKSDMPYDRALAALKSVFNRGDYCSAYLDKNAPFNVIYSKSQANIGRFVVNADRVDKKRVYVSGFAPVNGDGYKVMRHGTEIGGATCTNGEIRCDCDVKVGDELRITFDKKLSDEIKTISRKLKIVNTVELCVGEPPHVSTQCGDHSIDIYGIDPIAPALSQAIDRTDVVRAFNKVAEHPFDVVTEVKISGGVFMPMSSLNDLRRRAYSAIREELIKSNSPVRKKGRSFDISFNRFYGTGTMLMIDDGSVYRRELDDLVDYVVVNPRDYNNFLLPDTSKPILLNTPVVVRGDEMDIIKRAVNIPVVSGIVANNLYALKITEKPIIFGTGLNTVGKTDMPHIMSFESDTYDDNGFCYVYGYAPLMTLCHCPYGKCIKCKGEDNLSDEMGRKFKLRRYKLERCYWQLLNCVPHNLLDKAHANRFLDCTELSYEDICNVLAGKIGGEYTRGNLNKGLK